MSPIQFGWVLPMPGERNPISRSAFLRHLSRGLDLITGHFHSAWCCDHLQFDNNQILEGWTMLTYLLPLYPQLMFGTLVLSQSYRNPALLAKMAATLQYMSNGRLIFGIGAGWHEAEYQAYGFRFHPGGRRVAELEEALHIIKSLWESEETTLQGKYYQVLCTRCEPKPEPSPPIVIGGSKPQMLQVVARFADWWNADRLHIDIYREQLAVCEQACAKVQRDPASLRHTWSGGCICRETESALLPFRKSYSSTYGFIGTPDHILEQMQPFVELGVDYFMLHTGDFPDLKTLELLIHAVLPVLNRQRS